MSDTVLLGAEFTPDWKACRCDGENAVNLCCIDDSTLGGDINVVIPGKQGPKTWPGLSMNECNVSHTAYMEELSDQQQLQVTCEVVPGEEKVLCDFKQPDSRYNLQMYCAYAQFDGFGQVDGSKGLNSWGIASNHDSVCIDDHRAFYGWGPTGTCGRRSRSFTSHDGNGLPVSLEMHRVSKY